MENHLFYSYLIICKLYGQQLVELKELYDAEKLLSAELGGKLEKTQVPLKSGFAVGWQIHYIIVILFVFSLQKDLEGTRNALHGLEEKYNEAKSIIKEKEYVILNLQSSGLLK
jgi:kinesin family protein 11